MQHPTSPSAHPSCGARRWLLAALAVSPFTGVAVFVGVSLYLGIGRSPLLFGTVLVAASTAVVFLAFKLTRLSVTDTELVYREIYGLAVRRLPITSITDIRMLEERGGVWGRKQRVLEVSAGGAPSSIRATADLLDQRALASVLGRLLEVNPSIRLDDVASAFLQARR